MNKVKKLLSIGDTVYSASEGRHGIKFRLFCWWWMFKHRNWQDTRQKRKALSKAWRK